MSDLEKPVDLCRKNEIRFGQAVDGVSPDCDFDLTPCEKDIGMMSLLLGNRADAIYESEGRLEVRKLVGAGDVVLIDDRPLVRLGELTANVGEFFSFKRRNATSAGNTGFVSERHIFDYAARAAVYQLRRKRCK